MLAIKHFVCRRLQSKVPRRAGFAGAAANGGAPVAGCNDAIGAVVRTTRAFAPGYNAAARPFHAGVHFPEAAYIPTYNLLSGRSQSYCAPLN